MSGDVEALAEVLATDVCQRLCGMAGEPRLFIPGEIRAVLAAALLASDWMKRHDAEVRAGALREAASRWEKAVEGNTNSLDLEVADRVVGWLRARADREQP